MKNKLIYQPPNYLLTPLLIAVWIIGNIWTYVWFFDSLLESSLLNILFLIIAVSALPFRLLRSKTFSRISLTPQLRLLNPLLTMIVAETMAIVIKWTVHIPQLTMVGFIIASYGLLGLFIDQQTWQKNLTLAIITAGVVPFSVAFSSGLGFPVRVLSANFVAHVFEFFNLSAISSHDIILMENGIAQVDLPCSGMKSLWMGSIFLLGVTWLEKRVLGLRWFSVAIANLFFLSIANLVRVFILVLLIEVLQKPQIADILHLPLGLIGFIFACILTWALLQKVPTQSENFNNQNQKGDITRHKVNAVIPPSSIGSSKRPIILLLTIVFTFAIIGQFKPASSEFIALNSINLPADINTEKIALTEGETNFFDNHDNTLVEKVKFKSRSLSGSMLIVASDTWHSHHAPELCFVGNGFKVDKMNSTILNESINARWLSLQNGKQSATYWFQSSNQTTDKFLSRIWENITHSDKTWVLVSVLFDESINDRNSDLQQFTQSIYNTIDGALTPQKAI